MANINARKRDVRNAEKSEEIVASAALNSRKSSFSRRKNASSKNYKVEVDKRNYREAVERGRAGNGPGLKIGRAAALHKFNKASEGLQRFGSDGLEKTSDADVKAFGATQRLARRAGVEKDALRVARSTDIGRDLSTYKVTADGNAIGWGLNAKKFVNASGWDHARRAVSFFNPLGAATREELANSLGLITKLQKSKAAMGGINKFMYKTAIPGMAAFGMLNTLADGGNAMDYASDWVAPGVGLMWGMRFGRESASALAGAFGAGRGSIGAIGRFGAGLVGAGVGAVSGALLASGAMAAIGASTDSNNWAKRKAATVAMGAFGKRDFVATESEGTLTMRRKALMKIAKSGINDRMGMLGNEALILRGVM